MNSTSNDFNVFPDQDPTGEKKAILYIIVLPLLILLIFFGLIGIGALIIYLYKNVPLHILLLMDFIISAFVAYFFVNRTIIEGEDGLQEDDEE